MTAEILGRRLLGDVEAGSLEDLLRDLRKVYVKDSNLKSGRLGIPGLDDLWARHGGKLEITGRALPLLYHIISTAVSSPRLGTIVVLDVDGRFDVTRLNCSIEDLKHVHVFRAATGAVKATLDAVEDYLLYGNHLSHGKELVVTVVSGGQGGDVMAGWKGWLRVSSERDGVMGFGMGMSVEEALRERDTRQRVVDEVGWKASSDLGEYRWTDR